MIYVPFTGTFFLRSTSGPANAINLALVFDCAEMPVTLLGKEFDVVVDEYDSFGQSAFNLSLKERKKKARG